jgi:putative ABC transport system substrate-binding protein
VILRSALAIVLSGAILAAALAQAQPAKVPQVGVLLGSDPAASSRSLDAFRAELRERGYVEGQTIAIEPRGADGKQDRLAGLAAELVQLKVDVIVAGSGAAAVAAKHATATIPIVMVGAGDPVRLGLVASLARPGANVTGLTSVSDELWLKQLELLKEVVPGLSRVAVLWNPAAPSHRLALRGIEAAARKLSLRVGLYAARSPDDLEGAFAAMTDARAAAVLVLADTPSFLHRARVADLATQARLPAIYASKEQVEAGGLMAYSANDVDLYRRSAIYVDKILKGAKPADLPVEPPTTFDLAVNLKTARALDLTLPAPLLQRATEIIQ